jgi:chromosome segregation protein
VIVTHQKRTMDAADVLYGVSMGDGGVTKVVSRRLPRDGDQPALRDAGDADDSAAEAA